MNFEEKIFEMLTALSKGQEEMRTDIADLKATQAEQGKTLTKLSDKVDRLETVQA